MYRDKVYERNGFKSHSELVDMIRWLRLDRGMTLQTIGDLYGITKAYVQKLCPETPSRIVNRKQHRPGQSQSRGSRDPAG
jgi:hypothetical protein